VVIAVYVCLNYWAKWRKLEGKDAQAVRFEVFVGGRKVSGRTGEREEELCLCGYIEEP
jgi:hypothetical protein